MLGHFAGTQSRSPAPDDENDRAWTEQHLTAPIMLTHPASQARHQRPWHKSGDAAEDATSGGHVQPHREGTASMDVLTHKLSSSHLRLDNGIPAPLSRYSASACSSVAASGQPPELILEEGGWCPGSSSELLGQHDIPSSVAPTTESDLARHSYNQNQDVRRLRHKPSSRCLKEAAAIGAIQSRVEEMISTSTQCNVYIPPLVPVVPIEAGGNKDLGHEVVGTMLEVDDNPGADDESELALIDRLLSLRRASGTLGIRKSGFPLYRSSTDTALRCQNLVRNKPRMRRRKDRPKPSLSTTAGEASQQ
ncbi:hypothetical protein DHEL01_v211011 [Diaporthe helianthi]|uniref:Uncharacterized protein n=1 Tax=Diaporthe helianthi TaxID=158607 RepID=A0A2P5HK13_DIAHE|nr:hypothetical protein DHEL01_v211011 [Diaporthe helianthi]